MSCQMVYVCSEARSTSSCASSVQLKRCAAHVVTELWRLLHGTQALVMMPNRHTHVIPFQH